MAGMRILIVGAGIAGNCLAFWLSKLGHDITVIERSPSLRTSGLQIDLRGHGIEILRRMGLEEAFRDRCARERGIQVVDSSGRRRAFFPANTSGKGPQAFTSELEIMRGDMTQILYDSVKDGAKFVFGTSIKGLEEKDGSVEVCFVDGKTDRFDLVVGADGQWSRTRKIAFGPGGFYPINEQYVAYFTLPRPIQQGEEYIATMYLGTKRRGMMLRRSNPDDLQVYLGCTGASERLRSARRGDTEEEKAALAEVFQGAGWRTEEFVGCLSETNNFYCERLGLVRLESWSRGHIALVGDAAYCPSPNTGMGTTSAVIGAYILAGEIAQHCGTQSERNKEGAATWRDNIKDGGLVTALKSYQQKFEPFMKQVTKGVESQGNTPSSKFGLFIVYGLVQLASLLKVDIFSRFFSHEEVKGWNLPDYRELRA